jgi:AcrR family transcriptional regulator
MTNIAVESGQRTQAERRAASERELLRASLRLFAEQGFMGTTLAQIGAEAGYSRGLVTQRFGSKIGLAHALIELIRRGFEETSVAEMDQVPDHQVLHAHIDRYIRALEADRARYRALLALQAESITSLTELRPDLANLNEQVRTYLANRLSAAQARGEIASGIDVGSTVTATLGMLRGIASQFLIDPGRTDVRAAGDAAKRMLSELLLQRA